MIKIEKLSPDCVAYVNRGDIAKAIKVYLHMTLSHSDFKTLKLETGTITYSVDELEVKTMSAEKPTEVPTQAPTQAPTEVPTAAPTKKAGKTVKVTK